MYLALAVERHDHGAGRGKPAAKLAAGAVDTPSLGSGVVQSGNIGSGQVLGANIGNLQVTGSHIAAATITADKIQNPAVITTALGYTPINKAGDTGVGSLTMAASTALILPATGQIVLPSGATINGGGAIVLGGAAGGRANLSTTQQDAIVLTLQNTGLTPGYGLGVLNQAGSGWDFLLTHIAATFSGLVQAPNFQSTIASGTAPISVASTTLVTNLNAQYLNGQPQAYYGRATFEVPATFNGFFFTAGFIPTGWTRNTSADGRLIAGAGTLFGVTFAENGLNAATSWSHDHTPGVHTHVMSNGFTGTAADTLGIVAGGAGPASGSSHQHSIPSTTNSATPNNTGSYAFAYPVYSLVLAYKS
jgi:hypothetical protein